MATPTTYYSTSDLSVSSGAPHAAAVVADSTAFAYISRAIYVGGAGDVVAIMQSGATVTFPAVPSGSVLPIRATAITAGSTATSMVAMF